MSFDISPWREYLHAFDAHLAARRSDGDATVALCARRQMLAILQADPDYWRARREHRERIVRQREAVVNAAHRRAGRFERRAA